ncbi:hypothetical protein PIROE2DRAFT_14392 [Piromyces sp. E2]|nr:hypothetical protein PIROE2DRAFT_14392 [Piromyces sp. E2]|eukprot:OUM59948.1 hypothetical protein PIROE2DRAFT_14392 [Piromyces sp. E2]
MFTLLFVTLSLIIGLIKARDVTFNCIGFGTKMEISVDGNIYNLLNKDISEPFFSSRILNIKDTPVPYFYILDGVRENCTRELAEDIESTYNEFYGRKDTVKILEQFKQLKSKWTRSIGITALFDDSYIPTIHLSGSKTNNFILDPESYSTHMERVTFYLKNEIISFTVRSHKKTHINI